MYTFIAIRNYLTLLLSILVICSCNDSEKSPRLNDLQIIGSHNSYKIAIEKPLWDHLYQIDSARALSLQYSHITLEEQLDLGLRSLELDVFHDPLGGHFLNPKGLAGLKSEGKSVLPFDKEEALKQPGLKLFHIQDIDFRSHNLLFKDALMRLKQWSDAHPKHSPIVVLINAKDKVIDELPTKPLPFTEAALDSIDIEIKSVFHKKQLIIPDYIRGHFKTLEKAILHKGWPKLATVKGKFLFVLDEKPEKINRYLKGHETLKNRMLFVNSEEGNPEAAFRIVNDPVEDFEYIKALVKQGYMVRTRADAGTQEARTNDYTRFEKAKASGAQVISTDYYIPSTLFDSEFKIVFNENRYERIKNKK